MEPDSQKRLDEFHMLTGEAGQGKAENCGLRRISFFAISLLGFSLSLCKGGAGFFFSPFEGNQKNIIRSSHQLWSF